jgi:pimeloyl-ACP methyl ester carboxylesterase
MRMSRCFSVALLLVAAAFWSTTYSDDKKADKKEPAEKLPDVERANFQSIDGVQLKGSFYPSTKKNPPTVILLHNIGEDRKKKAWVVLAKQLQGRGFAVLTFDFRGHGESTDLGENRAEFWKMNAQYQAHFKQRAAVGKEILDEKTFSGGYYPVLCNDIAAARAYLDRNRVDGGEANTSNLIIIGAGESSTIGAIWINAEFHRHRFKPTVANGPPIVPDPRAEGNDVVACVWLGMSSKLDKQPVQLHFVLNVPARVKGVAMSFWYGKEDKEGVKSANTLLDNSIFMYKKGGKKEKEEKYQFTRVVEIPSTSLKGSELILKAKGVSAAIGDWLEGVVDSRNNDRSDYRFADSVYKWKSTTAAQYFPTLGYANMKGDKNLMWNSFQTFWR